MAIIPVTTAGYRTRPARLLQLQRNGSLPMAYGTETGTFLVLDLGDTTTVARLLLQKYRVSMTLKTGSDRFFRLPYWHRGCVSYFNRRNYVQITRDVDVDPPTMPLGLTFSFPVEQTVLDKYEKFISGMYLGEITRDTPSSRSSTPFHSRSSS
ncbi:hypothetical protein EDB89DRAFT_117645 [Lactarius sanguifluus]|nr:hypothetical protein EDB89DRAFT_117645 [Lactarius sanguifluus]